MKKVIQLECKKSFRTFSQFELVTLEKVKLSDGKMIYKKELVFEFEISGVGKGVGGSERVKDTFIGTYSEFKEQFKFWVEDERTAR